MTVAEATSTNGKFRTFSSSNATLATALSEVANALDANGVSSTQVQTSLTHDGTNFVYVALVKLH